MQKVDKIDVLIGNAVNIACSFAKTVDCIESQFGTKYAGQFLSTNLLMPKTVAAAFGGETVNVSNSAHQIANVKLSV